MRPLIIILAVMAVFCTRVSGQTVYDTVNVNLCFGQTYFAGGAVQSVSGHYNDTLQATGGGDSVVTTNLVIAPLLRHYTSPQICQGDTYRVATSIYTGSGSYIDTLQSAQGCDSLAITFLNVIPANNQNVIQDICQGQTYYAGGAHQSTSGTYIDSINRCSIRTTVLTVHLPVTSFDQRTICDGQTEVIHGISRTQTGIYVDTFPNFTGCDSIATVELDVLPSYSNTIEHSICDGDSVQVNGTYYSANETLSFTYASVGGCDSTVTYVVEVVGDPGSILGPDTTACDESIVAIAIRNVASDFENLRWWNGSEESIQTVTQPGTYWITVDHPVCGEKSDSVTVNFKDCNFYIYVPTAFTPNEDPYNPTFRAKVYGDLVEYELMVFNRWGKLVFRSEDPSEGWNGKINGATPIPDTYVWKVNYKSKYEENKSEIGRVTLLR